MSSFQKKAKNPRTGKWEMAHWLDNLFGEHNYGVVFFSDKKHGVSMKEVAYDPRMIKLETKP